MKPAPIILFVYNRPHLTRQTLQSLRANKTAADSVLHVFSDGPRSAPDERKINEVREIARSEQWCGQVFLHEREKNYGLAKSVIAGVSAVLKESDRVIVIEDDLLLSPFFLQFMNEALEKHKNDDRILSVGSWNYFCNPSTSNADYFYLRYPDSIAWATYARSWSLFEHDAAAAYRKLQAKGLLDRFNGGISSGYFEKMLGDQISGRVNSWAIRWTATSVLHNKLNVYPATALSKHMGFGSSATHEKSDTDYNSDLPLADRPLSLNTSVPVAESAAAFAAWKKFVTTHFIPPRKTFISRLRLTAYRTLRKLKKVLIPELTEGERLIRAALQFGRFKSRTFKFRHYELEVSDFLSVAQQIREYFEEERLKFVAETERPRIIDCGSNVGVSVLYFKSLYPNALIDAYEADAGIFTLLELNLKKNNIPDVTVNKKAVWVHSRGVSFSGDGADGGSVKGDAADISVGSIRLRDLISQHSQIDLLKMDIEGAECDVLVDCGEKLSAVRKLFVEYHSFAGQPQRLNEILELLRDLGFRYFIRHIGSQTPRPFTGVDKYNGMDMQLEIYAVNENER